MDRLGKGVPYVVAGGLVLVSLALTSQMERYAEPPASAPKPSPELTPPAESSPVIEPTTAEHPVPVQPASAKAVD